MRVIGVHADQSVIADCLEVHWMIFARTEFAECFGAGVRSVEDFEIVVTAFFVAGGSEKE
jgi:hypothetical protein